MEIEESLLVVGLCPDSEITQKSKESPIASMESIKDSL